MSKGTDESQGPGSRWGLPDAKGAVDYLARRIYRMGPRGRRLSLIIPVIIAVLIFGDFLKIIDDYVEWGDKVWTSFLSLWAREIDVDISVVDPPGIPITVKVRAGNKDIAQKSATSGPNPVTFQLPSTRT